MGRILLCDDEESLCRSLGRILRSAGHDVVAVDGPGGYRYLAVSEAPAPGDARESPFDLSQLALDTGMGTHILDLQFPQGDLIDMVARRAAKLAVAGARA